MSKFSLNQDIINKMLETTMPSFQATDKRDLNMGFGFIFYAFARNIRPKNVVCIGSKAGFSVISFALGINDNSGSTVQDAKCYEVDLKFDQKGKLHFIDPSYSIHREDNGHWYGVGSWDDEKKVQQIWNEFGIESIVTHFKKTSAEYLLDNDSFDEIDLLYIDGDHSYEGVKHDFTEFYHKMKPNSLILAHDVDPALKTEFPETGGYKALSELDPAKYEVFRLPIYPGLAIVRIIK